MKILLTIELIQSIVKYLETKPFVEVHQLLSEILKQANKPKEEKAPVNEADNITS